MNEIKNRSKEDTRKPNKLKKALDFDFNITKENAPKWLPFILYVAFWAIIYIANRHAAQQTEIEITQSQKEIKELRAEFLTIKAELMDKTTQSEVAKRVQPFGLKELKEPTNKLEIDQ